MHISYKCHSFTHVFLVVQSDSVNLLGRDLGSKMKMDIMIPCSNKSTFSCCNTNSAMPSNNMNVFSSKRNPYTVKGDTHNCNSIIHELKQDIFKDFHEYLTNDFQSCVTQTVNLNVAPGAKPRFSKAREIPIKLRDKVKRELQRLVENNRITKVFSSDWASPIVNILKSDGTVRICGDFSGTVNGHLDAVRTPLPSVDDVISRVGTATVFGKIDLSNAFLQLPLNPDSKKYTTINTPEGLYQYNFLPFGLNASPGIFQSFMDRLLNEVDNIIVYQDDILIFSRDLKEHLKTLYKVLSLLREAGIKLNIDKSSLVTDKVCYLGHVFDKSGVHPNPDKVSAISDAPAPTNLKQLQAFLGLCNFYSRFIPKYSDVMSPLYLLLKKNVKFHWGPEQEKCFQLIKELFISSKVLKLYNPSFEIMLETDSSGYGVAAVLMQRKDAMSPWYPVQFASRTLNVAERSYSNIEREALSVIFGCLKFRKFLLGSKFVIHNDQQPLRKLFAHDKPVPDSCSARVQRWALRLSQYKYKFVYSKGTNNVHSDCLSRLPLPITNPECEPYELIFATNMINKMFVDCTVIRKYTDEDKDLVQLKQHIKYGFPVTCNNPNIIKFRKYMDRLSIMKGCILYNNRVFIPKPLRSAVLNILHDDHPGICNMKSIARSLIWYPKLDEDITNLVKSCTLCQEAQAKPPQNRTISWPIPPRPWTRVHVDHFFYENKICLIAVDALSKYIEVEIVSSTSVEETIDVLRLIFSRNGLCDVLVSDNASCFTAQQFQEFCKSNCIQHITPPPYSPASNGQAERGVRVIKDLLKKCSSAGTLKTRLAKILLYYRSVPHSVTQVAPSVALNNRKFVTLKDRVNPNYCYVQKPVSDDKRLPKFKVGDKVLALNLRDGPKWYLSTVVQQMGINVFNVLIHQLNVIWKRHSNQLLAVSTVDEEQSENVVFVESKPENASPAVNIPNFGRTCTQLAVLPSFASSNNVPLPNNDVSVTVPNQINVPIQNNDVNMSAPDQEVIQCPLRRSCRARKPVSRYGFDD